MIEFCDPEKELDQLVQRLEKASLDDIDLFIESLEDFSGLAHPANERGFDQAVQILKGPGLSKLIRWPDGPAASKEAAYITGIAFLSAGIAKRARLTQEEATAFLSLIKLAL